MNRIFPCPHCYRNICFSADNDYRYLCHVDAACCHGRPFYAPARHRHRATHSYYVYADHRRQAPPFLWTLFPFGGNIPERHYLCGAASSMKIGRFAVMRYVLVKYGTKGKCAVLLPVKEDMFIKTLTNRLNEVKKY